MLCSKLCFVENLKPRPRKRAMPSRGSTRSIKFKSYPNGWAKEINMRKRALSWAVGVILAVFGCSEIVNTLLPGGVADPAGIVPVASGSATLQDNAGRFYQFANTGGAITMTGDCAGVQVFQSALSGASDPETLAFTGCSGTVQQPYIRLQQPSPLQVDHAWVTGSTGCDRYNPNSSLVWELDLAACGVGSGTPPPPQVSD